MSLTRRNMMGLRSGSGGNMTIVEVTLDQDYPSGFSSVAFSMFEAAVGTDFFAFCLSYMPETHTMAESQSIMYSGARLPALELLHGEYGGRPGYYDYSRDVFNRTYRAGNSQGPYAPTTNSVGVAGSKYKIWGWNK